MHKIKDASTFQPLNYRVSILTVHPNKATGDQKSFPQHDVEGTATAIERKALELVPRYLCHCRGQCGQTHLLTSPKHLDFRH